MGFDVKAILKATLPTIAAAFGGPFGPAAAMAIGKVLGADNAKEDDIPGLVNAAIATNPDVLLKLKAAEQDFALQMAKLGFDSAEKLEALAVDDRKDARAREIALRDRLPSFLAMVVTGGFLGLLWLLAFHQVPSGSKDILNILIGSLGTAWIAIISYYFGSSSGSAAKTELLAKK